MGKNKSTKNDGVYAIKQTQELENTKRMPLGYYKPSINSRDNM